MDTVYEVEKLLKRRTVDDQVQYYIKWLNYSSWWNTWEPITNLDCSELIDEFEEKNGLRILSVENNNGFVYLVKLKSNDAEAVSSDRARQLWPNLLIDFLEERLMWISHVHFVQSNLNQPTILNVHPISIDSETIGQVPINGRYLYATRVGRDLLYLVTWRDGSKFFSAKDARKQWPHLVIDFLEENLLID